jgi:hypothetical protein
VLGVLGQLLFFDTGLGVNFPIGLDGSAVDWQGWNLSRERIKALLSRQGLLR